MALQRSGRPPRGFLSLASVAFGPGRGEGVPARASSAAGGWSTAVAERRGEAHAFRRPCQGPRGVSLPVPMHPAPPRRGHPIWPPGTLCFLFRKTHFRRQDPLYGGVGGSPGPEAVWGMGGVVSSDKAALKTLFRVRSIWGRWRVSRGSLGYTCSSHGGETPVILRAHPGSRGLREELQALDVETGGRRGPSPEGLWSWAPEGQAWRSSRPAPRPQRPRLQPAPPCFCASGCTRLCSGGARPPRSTWSA